MIIEKKYDIVVVGAGHAGCEAALASARLGLKTIIFTVSADSIAMMPCNPNIGGSSKGHLVKELDALGGEMGKCIDKTFIQSKMLNASKGPAVHSLRAQADKQEYSKQMRKTLENTPNLTICQKEITKLIIEDNICRGVESISGGKYYAKAVVLATGTYLNARCIYGEVAEYTGPNGLKSANHLSDSLSDVGISLNRFKTGTPARVDGRSIDYTVMQEQYGDNPVVPFSFETDPDSVQKEQVKCYLAYTNEYTHEIIRENIDRSPLFSGAIKGTGPRYCPSIEDKVVKFPDKDRHQIFVEPEGLYTNEMYLSGLSSSLPEDVQDKMIRSIKGFENANIVRNGYAIEYDCIDARQLKDSLEFRNLEGLFAAGRDQGYIGVLIDDLVTKESHEPYRMMTSRSEYRLLLRQDNADLRLTKIGYKVGLISEERYNSLLEKEKQIANEVERLKNIHIGATSKVQDFLVRNGSTPLQTSANLAELIRRPELNYDLTRELDPDRKELKKDVRDQVNINIKYEGYIKRQESQVKQFKKLENKKIPLDIDYTKVNSLRIEAVQKLSKVRPSSIGQASRISGVSPADITVLLVYLETYKEKKDV